MLKVNILPRLETIAGRNHFSGKMTLSNPFSQLVSSFHGLALPWESEMAIRGQYYSELESIESAVNSLK
jgi:hypothetical protein